MGLPGALAAVSIGASIAGTAFEVSGRQKAAKAAQARGNFQAMVLRNNAKISRKAAFDALGRGQVTAQRAATVTGQFISTQRARLAASGVLVDEGSAADLVSDSAFVGQQAIRDIRENAEREFLAFQIEALNFENAAILAQMAGDAADPQVAATILGGAGDVLAIGSRFV